MTEKDFQVDKSELSSPVDALRFVESRPVRIRSQRMKGRRLLTINQRSLT